MSEGGHPDGSTPSVMDALFPNVPDHVSGAVAPALDDERETDAPGCAAHGVCEVDDDTEVDPDGPAGSMPDDPIETAAELIGRKFHAVPVGRNGKGDIKAPLGGKHWQHITRDAESIREEFPRVRAEGVGIKLGPGLAPDGGWLIDIEGDGPKAAESLRKLFGGEPPPTLGWNSLKGPHRLYVVSDDFADAVMTAYGKSTPTGRYKNGPFPDLEFRVGGLDEAERPLAFHSSCPPTPLPNGSRRTWFGPWEVATIGPDVVERLRAVPSEQRGSAKSKKEAAPAPPPGSGSIPNPPKADPFAPTVPIDDGGTARVAAYLDSALRNEADAVATAPKGTRNDRLNEAAFNLGTLVHHDPRFEARTVSALTAAALACGLGESETRKTILSGLGEGKARPRPIPPPPDGAAHGGGGSAASGRAASGSGRFATTDIGNGERFARMHAGDVRYCHPQKTWYVWDGMRYAPDVSGAAVERAKETARGILAEAAAASSDSERAALAKHAVASQSIRAVKAMLEMAESEPGVAVVVDDMDRDVDLFNFTNGTLDLRTGNLRPHDRADMLTRVCPHPYDPTADRALWDRTLHGVFRGDAELIAFFKRLCGMAMSGRTREHKLPIFWGDGGNGKSTVVSVIMHVFGSDYAMKAETGFLAPKKHESHSTEKMDLWGKRLVVAVETAEGQRFDETLVKELTGGDPIRGRRLFQESWQFDPTHTIFLATNYEPTVRGNDNGIWRRLMLVPFTAKFDGAAADKDLPANLEAIAPGILAWCVEGALEWRADGLNPPAAVVKATSGYREEQDQTAAFLADAAIVDPDFRDPRLRNSAVRVKSSTLYAAYKDWATAAGERPMSNKMFTGRMKAKGFDVVRSNGMLFLGVALKPDDPFSASAAP